MLKHTPGPWKKSGRGITAKNRMICTQAIADGECDANARLIAAAPEMLDALKLARAHVQWRVNCEFNAGAPPTGTKAHAALVALDAAIAKAEGEVSNA